MIKPKKQIKKFNRRLQILKLYLKLLTKIKWNLRRNLKISLLKKDKVLNSNSKESSKMIKRINIQLYLGSPIITNCPKTIRYFCHKVGLTLLQKMIKTMILCRNGFFMILIRITKLKVFTRRFKVTKIKGKWDWQNKRSSAIWNNKKIIKYMKLFVFPIKVRVLNL